MKRTSLTTAAVALAFQVYSVTAEVRFVDVNSSNPIPPFTNWATAANVIQDAIDVAEHNDEILATNGVYQTGGGLYIPGAWNATNRVAVTKRLLLRSINGPAVTAIVGKANWRCVYLTNGSALAGFTLTNGLLGDYFFGGGVFCQSSNQVAISNCVVVNNTGGGVYSGTLTGCLISRNVGGGVRNAMVINSHIVGNFATSVPNFDSSGGGASGCTLINCIVANNAADTGGGTSYCKIINCTVVGNLANTGGGIASTTASNSIIVGNLAANGNNFVYPEYSYSYGGSILSYCCTVPETNGPGNIFVPPEFVDEAANDFRLQPNSPCIDAGNGSYVIGTTDLDGAPRIRGSAVDMGAYEFQGSQPALKIVQSEESITLAWPLWASDFGLQQVGATPDYAGGWSNLNASSTVISNENTVILPIIGELKLFRLHKP